MKKESRETLFYFNLLKDFETISASVSENNPFLYAI
jgi:hypothetical protein